jgi:hypothetical protein
LVFLLIKVYPEKSPKDLPKTNDEQTKQTFLQNKERRRRIFFFLGSREPKQKLLLTFINYYKRALKLK